MKTTLDISDDLLLEAKHVATRRRTTLKALVEHALRREVFPSSGPEKNQDERIEIGPRGLPQFKRLEEGRVSSESVYQLMEDEGV